MKECQIKPYIESSTSDKMEQQRLNSIHNTVFKRLVGSKLFHSNDGKLWEFTNKGVGAINKARQFVGQINRDYGKVVVRSGHPVKVDVRPLLQSTPSINIQEGNQYNFEGEVYPTYEDASMDTDLIKEIYSEIGLPKNSLIPSAYQQEVQTKIDEYNLLDTGKELYLHEVVGKYLIKERYKVSYLVKNDHSVFDFTENSPTLTDSNSNFNLPCITK